MTTERRTDEQIRAEIAAEREGLTDALTDLRRGIDAKRGLATKVAGAAAAGLAALTALKVVRRLRD
jgi:hypothetical protein